MNFEIQTSSYFDAEAKRLAKKHRSFIDDLVAFQTSILNNPYQGTELAPGIRKIRMTIASKGRGSSEAQSYYAHLCRFRDKRCCNTALII